MQRRQILRLAAGGIAASSLRALAQPASKVWRVGVLTGRRVESVDSDTLGGFVQGMRDLGYVEGKNLTIEWRASLGNAAGLPGLATELVRQKVDVILAVGTAAAGAAQKATSTIPIVIGTAGDPVRSGFVKTLARPGGNITGMSNLTEELGPKQLELLNSMVPKLARVAVLLNPGNDSHGMTLKRIQSAAQRLSVSILPLEARTPREIEGAFSKAVKQKAGAVMVAQDALFTQQQQQLVGLAGKHRLPTITSNRESVSAGLLMSYGTDSRDLFRRAASYVDKILKGAKPGDLPVEQPMKFDLIVNRKTARALGLTVPQSLLISAEKVID